MPEIHVSFYWLAGLAGTGTLIGLVSGYLGLGGSILISPIFHFVFLKSGFPPEVALKYAFGSGICVSFLTSFAGSFIHKKNIADKRITKILLLCVPVGAFLGAAFSTKIESGMLNIIFGTALLISGISFSVNKEKGDKSLDLPVMFYVFLGLFLPVASTFVGMGGAVFTTLILTGVLRYSIKSVIPVSNYLQALGSLFGTASFIYNGPDIGYAIPLSAGYVYFPVMIAMAAGTIPFALIGARRTERTSPVWLRRMFSVFLFAVAVKYIL